MVHPHHQKTRRSHGAGHIATARLTNSVSSTVVVSERFTAESANLLARWLALPKHRSDTTTVELTEFVSRAVAI